MTDTLQRGDSFEVYSDPRTDEMVVLDTDDLSGYRAALVAERNTQTGEWESHWVKASYIHDEANLGAVEQVGAVDEERLQGVEQRLQGPRTPEAPEGVSPAPSAD